MDAAVKELWIEALESDRFAQGTHALHYRNDNDQHFFCCLGVLCELAFEAGVCARTSSNTVLQITGRALYQYDESTGVLPVSVIRWAGLPDGRGMLSGEDETLAGDNDVRRKSFAEIAQRIREKL